MSNFAKQYLIIRDLWNHVKHGTRDMYYAIRYEEWSAGWEIYDGKPLLGVYTLAHYGYPLIIE